MEILSLASTIVFTITLKNGGARGVIVIVVGQWTRRHEFKSWTRLIEFHIVLIPLGKVWIQLFSLQLWVNSLGEATCQGEENFELKPVKLRLKIDLVSYLSRAEGLVNMITLKNA